MQTTDKSENPLAVAFIRRRGRVSEPAARTISELAGFANQFPMTRLSNERSRNSR
jgi:hypothetical protein